MGGWVVGGGRGGVARLSVLVEVFLSQLEWDVHAGKYGPF